MAAGCRPRGPRCGATYDDESCRPRFAPVTTCRGICSTSTATRRHTHANRRPRRSPPCTLRINAEYMGGSSYGGGGGGGSGGGFGQYSSGYMRLMSAVAASQLDPSAFPRPPQGAGAGGQGQVDSYQNYGYGNQYAQQPAGLDPSAMFAAWAQMLNPKAAQGQEDGRSWRNPAESSPVIDNDNPPGSRLFFSISSQLDINTLVQVFSGYGTLQSVHFIPSRRLCGYAKFTDATAAANAQQCLHGSEVAPGVMLSVRIAQPRPSDGANTHGWKPY
eukprot:NODE_1364_length_1184_cov_121.856388_g1120_i0.p1 GENE.NODE_1364_length_1184_cov_121.856388_g1120_i0~~NODE_1364_length_1184_cov_121.856388_g1120_i0.p1  ORF type:complete len:274 (+),score=43.87 NODE_1364_length_1184_cov_121.856388_g1120_i0:211-1032(+)